MAVVTDMVGDTTTAPTYGHGWGHNDSTDVDTLGNGGGHGHGWGHNDSTDVDTLGNGGGHGHGWGHNDSTDVDTLGNGGGHGHGWGHNDSTDVDTLGNGGGHGHGWGHNDSTDVDTLGNGGGHGHGGHGGGHGGGGHGGGHGGGNGGGKTDVTTTVNVQLMPNPAISYVTVNTGAIIAQYQLFDQSGRIVRSNAVGAQNTTIQLDGLAKGIYVLKVTTTDNQTSTQKLVVQ
jgi:hypothetical protein